LLFDQIARVVGTPHSAYDINPRKHRVDLLAARPDTPVGAFQYAASLLGIGLMDVFSPHGVALLARQAARPGQPLPDEGIDVEPCWTTPPSIKLGGVFFRSTQLAELKARSAFALTCMRPDFAPARAFQRSRLELLLDAGLSLSQPSFPSRLDPKALKKEQKLLEKTLSPAARAGLAHLAQQYAQARKPGDLEAYVHGVELTALRAALVAAGDASAVLRAITDRRGGLQHVSREAALRDLVTFAVGGDLHQLRVAVGMAVDTSVELKPGPAGPFLRPLAQA
jgi:hypothetical protein